MSNTFIKLYRNVDSFELLQKYPKAFLLLSLIALRARRNCSNILNLKENEALIGDYKSCGLTQSEYRHAKNVLQKLQIVTIKATNKGSIATIINTDIYDINIITNDKQNNKLTTSKRQANDKLTTTNNNDKNNKNEKNNKNINKKEFENDIEIIQRDEVPIKAESNLRNQPKHQKKEKKKIPPQKEKKEKFDIFRKKYIGTKRGLDIEWENFIKKTKDWEEVLEILEDKLEYQYDYRRKMKDKNEWVPPMKNLSTWVNNRCWEEEYSTPVLQLKKSYYDPVNNPANKIVN